MTSVAILNGGRATRYGGADKSALVINGRSILEHQIEAARSVTDDILIVGRTGSPAPPAGVRAVADRTADAGPLGGLDAALAAARGDAVVLLACDMPGVTGEFLDALALLAPVADAIVPKTERGYHPLCAVYRRRCHQTVVRRLAAGQWKMLDLLNDLSVRAVETRELEAFGHPLRLLANVNTPAALDELATLHGHKP
jgi:molybdopterin-guanine dinucleotide biosynthesis protein A